MFTGRLRFTGLGLAERQGPEAFVELERIEARLRADRAAARGVRLAELTLVAPSGRMVRTASGEFNFSNVLQHVAAARASRGASPGRSTVAVDRLTITKGAVRVRDETVAPADANGGCTHSRPSSVRSRHARGHPGHGVAHGLIDEARLDLTGERLTLSPLGAVVTVVLDGFALQRLGPYMASAAAPYRITGGKLGATLTAVVDHEGEKLTKAALSGRVHIEGETLARARRGVPRRLPHRRRRE